MTLPAKADLTTAGAATSAPTVDEDQLLAFTGAVRDYVESVRTALVNNGTLVSSTTAALAAVGNAINTTGKTLNKTVYNATDGKLYFASGTTAASPWTAVAPDTGSITPA